MSTETKKSENRLSTDSAISIEERAKHVLEENIGLKSYIENMNSECLELNAALFEEANKMVTQAKREQHAALREVKEKSLENDALRFEVSALKKLVGELSSALPNLPTRLSVPEVKYEKFRKKSPRSSPGSNGSAKIQESKNTWHSTLNLSGMEQKLDLFSRRELLNSVLTHRSHQNYLDVYAFQEFLDWIQSGCPLTLPKGIYATLDAECKLENPIITQMNQTKSIEIIRTKLLNNITSHHSSISSIDDGDSNDEEDDIDIHNHVYHGNEHDSTYTTKADSTTKTSNKNNNKYSTPSIRHTFSAASTNSSNMSFLHCLYEQDIKTCLNFENKIITKAIYEALPLMALEIIPLTQKLNSPNGSSNPSKNNHTKIDQIYENEDDERCALLSKYSPEFEMKIKLPTSSEIVCKISAQARDRIVAVVNLFQYLSLIKRGFATTITTTPTTTKTMMTSPISKIDKHYTIMNLNEDSNHLINDINYSLNEKILMREQQFFTIQRHRLAITFARLGYGLPDLD